MPGGQPFAFSDATAGPKRLRRAHPQALLIPTTVIPQGDAAGNLEINALVRQVAAVAKLPLFDLSPNYLAALEKGPDMLN